jgi:hypothetical protein
MVLIRPPPAQRGGDRTRRTAPRRVHTGQNAAQREQTERRPCCPRLEEKEVDALRQTGEPREDRVEPSRGHEPERQTDRRGDEHEDRRLEQDLRDDAPAPHADRAHHGDLADALVDRHGDERRDEQEADDEAHRTENDGELAEVAQPLVHLLQGLARGDHGDGAQLRLELGALALDVDAGTNADHGERRTAGRRRTIHRAQRADRQRDRTLVEGEIDESHSADEAQRALAGIGAQLWIVARRGAHRVAERVADRAERRVVGDDLVRRGRLSSGDELVVALHRRLYAERARRDGGAGRGKVQLAAEHRTRRDDGGARTDDGEQAVRTADRRLGVEGERAARREAKLEPLREQQPRKDSRIRSRA